MTCEEFEAYVERLVQEELPPSAESACRRHAAQCTACHDLLTGIQAVLRLRGRTVEPGPEGLAARLVAGAVPASGGMLGERRFWQGAASGLAVAAVTAVLLLALQQPEVAPAGLAPTVATAEFSVALNERRLMDLAIEADRPLADARITIELSGGVELDGYGLQRTVEWNTDLKAGVNRLSLPVVAVDAEGGRMVVRLSHPQSEQVFVVRLKTEV